MAIQVAKFFKIEVETAPPAGEAAEALDAEVLDAEEGGGVPKASLVKLSMLLDVKSGTITVTRKCKSDEDCKGCCGSVRTALFELSQQETEHADLNELLAKWNKDNEGGIVPPVVSDGKCVGDRCQCLLRL